MSVSAPEFVVFTGPMFGSKTTRLLDAIDRAGYQKKRVALFKASMDDRYSSTYVCTHSGNKVEGVVVDSSASLLEHLAKTDIVYDIVAVDEAFMIDGIGDVLVWLFKRGISIFVATLSLSAGLDAFDEVVKILPWATRVEVCSAVCTTCGADAYFTHKKVEDGKLISVGGSDLYEPRCWHHHHVSDIDNE
jgi:thymidine kinase